MENLAQAGSNNKGDLLAYASVKRPVVSGLQALQFS